MKAVALLVFIASNQGYWTAGQDQTVTARWVVADPAPPAADLAWELVLGRVKLAGGSIPLAGDKPTAVTLKAPDVRVRTALQWRYRVVRREGGADLDRGELSVHVFPAELTADWPARVGSRKLVVWDSPDGLPKPLAAAKVPFSRVSDLDKVLDLPDLILVGRDQLDASPFAQGPLLRLAEAGAGVAVLEQSKPERLAGYELARRERPAGLQFRTAHPLFDRFDAADLASLVAPLPGSTDGVRAVRLPADEPALELAWWPREVAGAVPVPVDALVVAKAVGRGRAVLVQLPLGPVDRDPRSQLLLGNLLSYLCTPPEATPSPSRRPALVPVAPATVPTIDFR
jgi:hypothetical protein